MGDLVLGVIEIGMVLALLGLVIYYRSRSKSSAEEATVAKSARDQEAARAVQAEDDRNRRDALRFEAAKEKAKSAKIDDALDAWVAARKLWPRD